ncbi:glycosyltransferase family 2 protein [Fodinibius sediminis]|nr:glycosyltransferase [Fodinibius sediminis]
MRKKNSLQADRNRYFAIVLSATQDEQVLSKSLYSLFGLVYPKNLYDVILLGDRFSEEAARVAREMGAIVYNGDTMTNRSQEYTLSGIIEQILNGSNAYDAVLVIESESLISGNYLDVINYYLDHGSKVIQSSSLMLPQSSVREHDSRQMNFFTRNLFHPVGRKGLKYSMDLRGNNFCFSTDTLHENLELIHSLEKDTDYGLRLQLNGIDVDFAPEAVVWKQLPGSNGESRKRLLWSNSKQISLVRRYLPEFCKAALSRRSPTYFKKVLDMLTPSVMTMLVFTALMIAANIAGWIFAGGTLTFVWLWLFVGLLGTTNLAMGLYTINTYFQAYKSIV